MTKRRVHAEGTHVHYVTFSCYKRRNLLDPDICKRIVIGNLDSEIKTHAGICIGFVVMLNHVHTLVWFSEESKISAFMDKWKENTSRQVAAAYQHHFPKYWAKVGNEEWVWQERYYGFNIFSDKKLYQKLEYIHNNPVKSGLVADILDWPWSSARWWHRQKPVGISLGWPP